MWNAVAARAAAEIGTPFRLFGRTSGVALDCVGLVALALQLLDAPRSYSLKGNYSAMLMSYMDRFAAQIPLFEPLRDGDIAFVSCGLNQQHLMIRFDSGWVHAHAGLGRVVHMPGPSPWPIICLWRVCGD